MRNNLIQGFASVFAKDTELYDRLHWILRISSALCFIGHGAWGVLKKPGSLAFYDIFNIPPDIAFATMPIVGIMDIALGATILFVPARTVMLYMGVWTVFTALLRPWAGMGWWEFLERAGNYGAPLALLYLSGSKPGVKSWFQSLQGPPLDHDRAQMLTVFLRVYTACLLIGHGGYGAFHKKAMLINHWTAVGLPPAQMVDTAVFITCVGWFEIFLGALVLVYPRQWLCLFIVGWKLTTEFLYVVHGPVLWEIFEFIERWGSYGVPLALYFLLDPKNNFSQDNIQQSIFRYFRRHTTDETSPSRNLVQH